MTRRNTMLTIFTKIKEFFLGKPQAPVVEAPYKVEAPVSEKVTVTEAPAPTYVAPALKIVNGSTPKVSNKPRERAKPKAKPVAAQPAKPKSKGQTPPKDSPKPMPKTAQTPKK